MTIWGGGAARPRKLSTSARSCRTSADKSLCGADSDSDDLATRAPRETATTEVTEMPSAAACPPARRLASSTPLDDARFTHQTNSKLIPETLEERRVG